MGKGVDIKEVDRLPSVLFETSYGSMAFFLPSARCGHVSAKIAAKVYVWDGSGSSRLNTSHLYIFDNIREKWHSKTAGRHPQGYKHCASTQSGSMLVYGARMKIT